MIEVSRLNGKTFYLNPDLIRTIESTPDTMICLNSGEKLLVKEDIQAVIERVVEYRKRLFQEPVSLLVGRSS